ncbi:non-specific serine/threonine protein kinase [Ranunculus cassubicifolius]
MICRIKFQIRVQDNTAEHDLTAFEETATELLGKNVEHLIALDKHGGDAAVQNELDQMIGKEYYFNIQISEYNLLHPEKSLTATSATSTDSPKTKKMRIGV